MLCALSVCLSMLACSSKNGKSQKVQIWYTGSPKQLYMALSLSAISLKVKVTRISDAQI